MAQPTILHDQTNDRVKVFTFGYSFDQVCQSFKLLEETLKSTYTKAIAYITREQFCELKKGSFFSKWNYESTIYGYFSGVDALLVTLYSRTRRDIELPTQRLIQDVVRVTHKKPISSTRGMKSFYPLPFWTFLSYFLSFLLLFILLLQKWILNLFCAVQRKKIVKL